MSSKQLLPLSGALAVILVIVAFAVGGETPGAGDSARDVVSYYSDNETELAVASALLALGAFFFLLFASAIRAGLREARGGVGDAAADLGYAGAIVFAIGITIFAGLSFTSADIADDVGAGTLQTLNALNSDMFFTVAVGAGAFLIGAGVAGRRTGLLPQWMWVAAIVIGVVALTPAGFFGFIALGIWTLVASVMLAMRSGAPARP